MYLVLQPQHNQKLEYVQDMYLVLQPQHNQKLELYAIERNHTSTGTRSHTSYSYATAHQNGD